MIFKSIIGATCTCLFTVASLPAYGALIGVEYFIYDGIPENSPLIANNYIDVGDIDIISLGNNQYSYRIGDLSINLDPGTYYLGLSITASDGDVNYRYGRAFRFNTPLPGGVYQGNSSGNLLGPFPDSEMYFKLSSTNDTVYENGVSTGVTGGYYAQPYTIYDNFIISDSTLISDIEWIGDTPEAQGTVPIPSAVWLFGSGLLGLIGVARRKVCV